jgi:hypothetical protein
MGYKITANQLACQRRWYSKNKEKVVKLVARRRKEIKVWLRDLKTTLKCSRCPEDHWACLDFHHSDPSQKDIGVAQAVRNGWSRKRILDEIFKCEVLCKNCHAKEHAKYWEISI